MTYTMVVCRICIKGAKVIGQDVYSCSMKGPYEGMKIGVGTNRN